MPVPQGLYYTDCVRNLFIHNPSKFDPNLETVWQWLHLGHDNDRTQVTGGSNYCKFQVLVYFRYASDPSDGVP